MMFLEFGGGCMRVFEFFSIYMLMIFINFIFSLNRNIGLVSVLGFVLEMNEV